MIDWSRHSIFVFQTATKKKNQAKKSEVIFINIFSDFKNRFLFPFKKNPKELLTTLQRIAATTTANMPRTKVSKSSKRNREAANREEKIREFENTLEGFQNSFEGHVQAYITSYEQKFKVLLDKTNSAMLKMKLCDLFELVSIEYRPSHTLHLQSPSAAG